MPGLGQLYLGDFPRGLCFLFGVALAVPVAARLALCGPPQLLCFIVFAGVLAALSLYVWSVGDAWRRARWAANNALHSWQRPSVYALYVVPSASMSPGILPGDRIFADKTIGQPGGTKLWRGALVVFIYPNDRTSTYIKRVVGLPGDRVEIAGQNLRINGQSVSEGPNNEPVPSEFADLHAFRERGDRGAYTVLWAQREASASSSDSPNAFVVPDGQIFVLGDNRSASVDSRRFGTVSVADVKAVARQIWFSISKRDGIRWDRLGKVLG
jgi:signal peptidase I